MYQKPRVAFVVLVMSFFAFGFVSCDSEESAEVPVFSPTAQGFFVVNEGRFLASDGEVSFVNTEQAKCANSLFYSTNSRPLGDIAQSMTRVPEGGYLIVVNNSNKIERTDAQLKSLGTSAALQSPRYALASNATALAATRVYVSEWGTGNYTPPSNIAVLNRADLTVVARLTVPVLAEELLLVGNTLLVANAGFASRDTLARIDISTQSVLTPIALPGTPVSMAQDANARLWVACKKTGAHKIIRLDGTFSVLQQQSLSGAPQDLQVIGNVLYWRQDNAIYRWAVDLAGPELITSRPHLYGLGVDAARNHVIALRAPSFTATGFALRINATSGAVIDSFEVGIGPTDILPR